MNELQDEYINDNRITQSLSITEKQKIRDRVKEKESYEMQKKIEKEIPNPKKNRKITDEELRRGDISKKVSIRINEKTVIYVDPDKIETAKENWLKRHDEAYKNTFKKGIDVTRNNL